MSRWAVLYSSIGVGVILGILYAWSVISKGLMSELGWTSTQASLPYTVFTVCMSLGFFLSGQVQDKLGTRVCVAACAVLMGAGLLLCGMFTKPLTVVIGFGLICGLGVGVGNASSLALVLRWFPASKKGMVSGAVLSGIGFSAVIYSPLSNFLLGAVGVSVAFIIFGAISFICMFLLSFNMIDPPDGYDREKSIVVLQPDILCAEAREAEQPAKRADENGLSTREMVKRREFYLLFATFAISAASGLMIIAHAAKITQVQGGWEGGFLLVIILNFFNTAGRFLGGSLSDRIGCRNTLKLVLIIQAMNMVLFRFYTAIPPIALGIMVQGFCYGTIFAVMPSFTTDLFGFRNFGSNYGTVVLAWGVGGVIGPMTAARVFDVSGDYGAAYYIACVLSLASLALVFALRKRKVRSAKVQPVRRQLS